MQLFSDNGERYTDIPIPPTPAPLTVFSYDSINNTIIMTPAGERVLTWAVSTPQGTVLSGERLVHPSALSVVVVPTFQGGVVLTV